MAKDITKVNIGTSDVYFKGVLVGHTQGGVTINVTMDLPEAAVDEYGSTTAFHVDNGTELTVTVPLAQTELATLEIAYPYAVKAGTDLHVGAVAGRRSTTIAGELLIVPKATAFAGQALTVHSAAVSETSEIRFATDEQTVIEVTFKAYIDEDSTEGVLAKFGAATLPE